MNSKLLHLADTLEAKHTLSTEAFAYIIEHCTQNELSVLSARAFALKKQYFGEKIYIRGLIEASNICKNDCLYCGIRKSNKKALRFRLSPEEILSCCKNGYSLGFRTFVLQGGEDGFYTDDILCRLIADIKALFPDCAVTLSLGERTAESYKMLLCAGADRYLLRHETADEEHYKLLHPDTMSFENRISCLYTLKKLGYQTGCGFMVGSPFQSIKNLAQDLSFIAEFKPQMVGLGPFIPHCDTPFGNYSAGTLFMTLLMLALVRIMQPRVLLPATTALATVSENGRRLGLCGGANVVMPNLSPASSRGKYSLYDNKAETGAESVTGLSLLQTEIEETGQKIAIDRGDY